MYRRYVFAIALTIPWSLVALSAPAHASEEAEETTAESSEEETWESGQLDTVKITGSESSEIDITPGSAALVDREALERFEYDDINRILATVPGVYIRQEDGYGLRPNIGMRGASSDRSKKVVLLEDGILLGPAPYAAPAAYYFPLVTRMHGVEVYKGPVSIQHGPNTVGGAVNLMTTPIPRRMRAMANLEGGQDAYGKVHLTYGDSSDQWGWLVEGVRLQTTGFKELDGGGDTGFQKHDVMLKGRWNSDPDGSTYQQLDIKLGYADEISHETYLGLTEDDLRATPHRRYLASKDDTMEWSRTQLQLSHSLLMGEDLELRTTLYRHDFERTWRKLNKFKGRAFNEVLSNPDFAQNAIYVGVLRGEEDALDPSLTLEMGRNNRVYVSQGVQSVAKLSFDVGSTNHNFELGVRYHMDQVIRDQVAEGMLMLSGELTPDGLDAVPYTDNTDQAAALAIYAHDELAWEQLVLTPGLRMEWITMSREDRLSGFESDSSSTVFLPGLGVYYGLTRELGILAGAHKGFSPVSPGQDESVKPESSINYEFGTRYGSDVFKAEVIGFYNDYSNLVGICTIAGGCPAELQGLQTNAGAATVVGAEVLLQYELALSAGLTMPLSASYTFTRGTFDEDFESSDPIFGDALAGDFIPYVPEHQAWVQLALSHDVFGFAISGAYTSAMRDGPGQDPLDQAVTSDAYFVVDAALTAQVFDELSLYVKGDNVMGEQYMVARRPYGVRPGKPMRLFLGLKASY